MSVIATTFQNALMITGFVFIMMLVIEYINVVTKGNWDRMLSRWKAGQWIFGAFLGATPGCLGAYAIVSLYMHRVATFGALVAAMIATSGDEAFVMLAMFPKQALLLFAILFILGILAGCAADLIGKRRKTDSNHHIADYTPSHDSELRCVPFSRREITDQWKNCSAHRGWLTVFLALFLLGVISGQTGHSHQDPTHDPQHAPAHSSPEGEGGTHDTQHAAGDTHTEIDDHQSETTTPWNWIRITLLLSGLVGLLIVVTVPDHFLEEHLWNHIARTHVWRIFLWTVGALLLVHLIMAHVGAETLVQQGRLPLLVIACLIGIIPESGPHLVFVTLYAQGAIPFSVLLTSSIVQDGHGMIPLLAHSRRAFVVVKAINILIGLLVGLACQALGY